LYGTSATGSAGLEPNNDLMNPNIWISSLGGLFIR
jgi:hypothetical protein